jgi:hypothetical protein
MKVILLIPCVLYFATGLIDAVDAADKNLRGLNRDLQFEQFEPFDFGSAGSFATLTPTNPTESSLAFQFLGQPSQTNNNAPVLGNSLFTFPTNPTTPGALQPTDPADTPMFGGFGSGGVFDFAGIMFDEPFSSEGSQTGMNGGGSGDQIVPSPIFNPPPLQAPPGSGAGDPPPTNLPPGLGGGLGSDVSTGSGSSSGCRKSEGICPAVFEPVTCEGGCQYGNSCEALGAGFAENQCRPDGAGDPPPTNLPHDGSTGSGSSSGCQKSEGVCPELFKPVTCEGGCQYGNSCEALGAGFAANQCRPD